MSGGVCSGVGVCESRGLGGVLDLEPCPCYAPVRGMVCKCLDGKFQSAVYREHIKMSMFSAWDILLLDMPAHVERLLSSRTSISVDHPEHAIRRYGHLVLVPCLMIILVEAIRLSHRIWAETDHRA